MDELLLGIKQIAYDVLAPHTVTLLNRSVTAGYVVMAVLIARLLLRRAPRRMVCPLWGLVAVRLLCPVSVESITSLIPSSEPLPPDFLTTSTPYIQSGIPLVNSAVNPVLPELLPPAVADFTEPQEDIFAVFGLLWLLGAILLLSYMLLSYLRLTFRLREAVCAEAPSACRARLWVSDRIGTPFIFGILRPRIYLPTGLHDADRPYVLLHEQAHLRRGDHLWKPLGFILLAIHWFNPLLWIAYILLCRDMERATDERVLATSVEDIKKPYAEALLRCSMPTTVLAACPLAFGEVGIKSRIKSVLNYKKPALWLMVAAALVLILAALCFLTDPIDTPDEVPVTPPSEAVCWFDSFEDIPPTASDMTVEGYPGITFCLESYGDFPATLTAVEKDGTTRDILSGMPILNLYLCDLTADGLPELCATVTFGSGMVDTRVCVVTYRPGYGPVVRLLVDRGHTDYAIVKRDGALCLASGPYQTVKPNGNAYDSYRPLTIETVHAELEALAIAETEAAIEKGHVTEQIAYDIDGDGNREQLILRPGPTSGILTMWLEVYNRDLTDRIGGYLIYAEGSLVIENGMPILKTERHMIVFDEDEIPDVCFYAIELQDGTLTLRPLTEGAPLFGGNPKIIQHTMKTAAMRNHCGGKKIVVCVNNLS